MDAQWWLPPVTAFVISFFTSMVGISGAFLLLPIQISFLGLTGPAVSATNLVFNLIAIPAGVYRYWREKRISVALGVDRGRRHHSRRHHRRIRPPFRIGRRRTL